MTSKNRFYMWVAIILAGVGLLLISVARSATRSYAIKNTAHAIPLDSAKLFWGYLGSATVVDSTAGAARGATPQNYDSTITLINADSTYWLNYRLYPTGDSAMDYRLPDIVPLWQLDDLAGNGLDTVVISVTDTGTSTPIVGAFVQLENTAGVPVAHDVSDASGIVVFGTRSGSAYVVRAFGPATKLYPSTSSFTSPLATIDTISGYTQTIAAATGASNVQVYIDVGTGQIDSTTGLMTIRPRTELTLTLRGNPWAMSGGWFMLPTPITKAPDANGRVAFNVPANSKIDVPGSFYELTYKAFDGRSISTGLIRKFWIDTLPDPIRIDSTMQVF